MDTPSDILIVDDDPDMVETMLLILSHAGYAVRGARNGLDALAAVAERRPALVLLDMLMPVMDGWRCAQELRARYGHGLAIVVLTAAEHAGARASEVAADGVLAKPFEIDDLLAVVTRYAGAGAGQPVGPGITT